MKRTMVWTALTVLSLTALAAAAALPQTAETVTCPVSGETLLKSQAKATMDYEGRTLYFCCAGCKEKFVKDPAKYAGKTADAQDVYTCPMHPEVRSDKPGKCPKCGMNLEKAAAPAAEGQACPLMGLKGLKDVEFVKEDLANGILIRITAKDPETVKKIRDLGAKITATHEHKH